MLLLLTNHRQCVPVWRSHCSLRAAVVMSDMSRVFHIWRVLLSDKSWMIMLSKALHERVSCTHRINSLQRLFTGHIVSHLLRTLTLTIKTCIFVGSFCLSVAACKFFLQIVQLYIVYVHTFSWCFVDVKSSKAAVWKLVLFNVSLVIALSFISECQEKLLFRGNWVLADRSVKHNQSCQTWN